MIVGQAQQAFIKIESRQHVMEYIVFKLSLNESNVSRPELSGTMLHPTTLACSAQRDTSTLADLSLG